MRLTCFHLIALFALAITLGCGSEPTAPATTPAAPTADSGSSAKSSGSETTTVAFNVDGSPTMALLVPTIHCEGCAANVSNTLVDVAGVKEVSVDVETKTATVAIDEAAFDAAAAIAALDDANFPDASVSEGSELIDADGSVSAEDAG